MAVTMRRINVVGTSGSGKSTFSKHLAGKLSCPYYEMDSLFWKANWQESTDEEFFEALSQVTSNEHWVLDGNYNRTVPIKWHKVDTVIWIDYSLGRTLYQAVKRAVYRIISQKELWPNTGNKESLKKVLASKDSILLWTLKTYHTNKIRYQNIMTDEQYSHIQFVRITSPKEAKQFIENIIA